MEGSTYVPLRGHGPHTVQSNEDVFSTQYAVHRTCSKDLVFLFSSVSAATSSITVTLIRAAIFTVYAAARSVGAQRQRTGG